MMHAVIGMAAILEKHFSLLGQVKIWDVIILILFRVPCNHSPLSDHRLLVFFIVLYCCCNNFGSILFTDHPQVTTRKRNWFSFEAGDDCRQQLCKYTNPRATASQKLQQAAC